MPEKDKILVVDDDESICAYLENLLSQQSYDVITATTGESALEMLTTFKIDVVLLDLVLPDIDGFRVLDYIHQQNPDIKVIIITGFASIESAVEAIRKGAYDYLRKPFVNDELLKTTSNALAYKRLIENNRRSEIALLESEDRFTNLIVNSLSGIAIIQNGHVVYQNPEQRKLFHPLKEPFSLKGFKCVHPDDFEKVRQTYQSLISKRVKMVDLDFRFTPPGKVHPHKDMVWVQCRAGNFVYKNQDALLVNMMDISRAKELEKLIIIKDKMASLGRVAAGIAHEIRNPLTGINSYLFSLEDICSAETIQSADIDMIKQITSRIQMAANKIETVVKRVLDFSKPSTPKMVKIDINTSLKEVIALSVATLKKDNMVLEESLEEKLPQCYGDAHLIGQVVLNLINNAANAMRNVTNEKRIRITSYKKQDTVNISVADSGPGVPLDLREKIFDPFFTTDADGSGIGLSISQRIVADHDGSIHVGTSILGGADFNVEIPIEKRINPR